MKHLCNMIGHDTAWARAYDFKEPLKLGLKVIILACLAEETEQARGCLTMLVQPVLFLSLVLSI